MKGNNIMFCGNEDSGILQKLENVSVYNSTYDCLYAEGVLPYEVEKEDKDFCDYLLHVDDWEPVRLIVLNGETVVFCDSLNGDVSGFCTLSELWGEMQALYDEYKD